MAKIRWKMTAETHQRYTKLLNEMAMAAKDADQMRYECAKDAFRALPGFPPNINEDLDLVVPKIAEPRIITSGSIH